MRAWWGIFHSINQVPTLNSCSFKLPGSNGRSTRKCPSGPTLVVTEIVSCGVIGDQSVSASNAIMVRTDVTAMTSQSASPIHVVGIVGEATTAVIPETENNAARNDARHIAASIFGGANAYGPHWFQHSAGSLEIIQPLAASSQTTAVNHGLKAPGSDLGDVV